MHGGKSETVWDSDAMEMSTPRCTVRRAAPIYTQSHGLGSTRLFIVWTHTRVQSIAVRSGSVDPDATFARFARTRARLGLWASR
jgi:hypothetical protein